MWGRGGNYITRVQMFFSQSDSVCRPLGLIGYYCTSAQEAMMTADMQDISEW